MNYIEQIFNRCDIETISNFLMHGGEVNVKNTDSYYERTRKADGMLNDWLTEQFKSLEEIDKHSRIIYSVIGEMQSVYMQIGMQAGIMLASEFYAKKQ